MQVIIFVRGEQLFDCVIGCVSAGSSNEVASGNTHKERGTWWVVGTLVGSNQPCLILIS